MENHRSKFSLRTEINQLEYKGYYSHMDIPRLTTWNFFILQPSTNDPKTLVVRFQALLSKHNLEHGDESHYPKNKQCFD